MTMQAKAQQSITVQDYGAKGDGTTDDTAAFNAALVAGAGKKVVALGANYLLNGNVTIPAGTILELQPGTYTMGNLGQFTLVGNTPKLWCSGGRDATIITVPQTYSVTDAVIVTNGSSNGTGEVIEGCQIQFSQPETAVRTSMIHYPFAIKGSPRLRLLHDKIVMAWDGVDFSVPNVTPGVGFGGSGALVNDLEISSFDVGIKIDNTGDTLRINNLHAWPFGFPLDATRITAYTDPANTGITSGRCDDLEISNALFYIGTSINYFVGTGNLPGTTFGNISNTGFDTFNGIVMSGGTVGVSSTYFSLGCATCIGISQSGGELDMAGGWFSTAASAGTIAMTGGTLQITGTGFDLASDANPMILDSGDTSDLRITGSRFNLHAEDTGAILVENQAYGSFVGNRFLRDPNINYTQPTITFATAPVRGIVADNLMTDPQTGSGFFANVGLDNWIIIHDNVLQGWQLSFPATHPELLIHDNTP